MTLLLLPRFISPRGTPIRDYISTPAAGRRLEQGKLLAGVDTGCDRYRGAILEHSADRQHDAPHRSSITYSAICHVGLSAQSCAGGCTSWCCASTNRRETGACSHPMPCYKTVGHLAVTLALHSGKLSENVVDLIRPRHARAQRTRSPAALITMVLEPSSWHAGQSATGGGVAGMPAIAPYAKADRTQWRAAPTTPFFWPISGRMSPWRGMLADDGACLRVGVCGSSPPPFEIQLVLMRYLVIPGMSIRAALVARIGRSRGGDRRPVHTGCCPVAIASRDRIKKPTPAITATALPAI